MLPPPHVYLRPMSLTTGLSRSTLLPVLPDTRLYKGSRLLQLWLFFQLIFQAISDTSVQAYSALNVKLRWLFTWCNQAIRLTQLKVAFPFLRYKAYQALLSQKIGLFSSSTDFSKRLQRSHSLLLPITTAFIASAQSIFYSKGNRISPWQIPVQPYFVN